MSAVAGSGEGSEAGSEPRRNLRLRLAYDGTEFHGWQIQPSVRTVQGELGTALARLLGGRVRVIGASRTDAGVHAREQIASVAGVPGRIGCDELARALNALMPEDVVILGVAEVPEGFHARFSAIGKRYRYRIRHETLREPWSRAHVWHVPRPLDVPAICAEAAALVGTHDFSSFQATGSRVASPIRSMRSIEVRRDGAEIWVDLVADGFLRHMVRNIVGTLVEVGLRHRPAGSTRVTLMARDRGAAGPTAPAHGLWLEQVFYPPDFTHEATTR